MKIVFFVMKFLYIFLSSLLFGSLLFGVLLFRQVKMLESEIHQIVSTNNSSVINNGEEDVTTKLFQKHQKDFFQPGSDPNGWLNFNNFLFSLYKKDWERNNLSNKKGLREIHPSQQHLSFSVPYDVLYVSDQVTEQYESDSSTSTVYGDFDGNAVTIQIARTKGSFGVNPSFCNASEYKYSESEQRLVYSLLDKLNFKNQTPDLCRYVVKRQLGHGKEADIDIRSVYWFNWGEYLKSNPAARTESDDYNDVIMFGVPNNLDRMRGIITLESRYYVDRAHRHESFESQDAYMKKTRDAYKDIPQSIFDGLDFDSEYYSACEYLCAY